MNTLTQRRLVEKPRFSTRANFSLQGDMLGNPTRVQRKGQVTIPVEARDWMGLEANELVTWKATKYGLIVTPTREVEGQEMIEERLNKIEQCLAAEGFDLDSLIKKVSDAEDQVFEEMYGDI